MSKPCDFSSAIAAVSCGIEALMFGSLMMLASGVCVMSPSSDSASPTRCSSASLSGKFARILPAREISRVSTSMPAARVKAWMIGSREYVASAGASSVCV